MKAVGKPTFGTLPDFGNFPQDKMGKYTIDVYDAIARMMPYAKGVSAKSYDFDDSGKETTLDYARIMKIVTDAGYHGFVGIEYEGQPAERARGHQGHQEAARIAPRQHVPAWRMKSHTPEAPRKSRASGASLPLIRRLAFTSQTCRGHRRRWLKPC